MYIAISVTLFIIGKLVTPAAIGLAIVATIMVVAWVALIALAGLAGSVALPLVAMMAGTFIIVSVAFLLLALALKAAAFVQKMLLESDVMFIGFYILGFLASLAVAGLASLLMLPVIIPLLIVAVALAVVFITLTIALFLSQVVLGIMDVTPMSDWWALGVWLGSLFLCLGLAGLAAILLLPFIVPLLIVSVLLAVIFVTLTIGLFLSQVVLGIMDVTPAGDWLSLAGWLSALFGSLILAGIVALFFIPFAVLLVAAAVLLVVIFGFLAISLALGKLVQKQFKDFGEKEINTLTDNILALYGVITPWLALQSVLIIIKALPVLAASVMLSTIFGAIASTYKSIVELKEAQSQAPDITIVMDAFKKVMEVTKNLASKLKDVGKDTLKKMKEGVGPIIEAVSNITDVVMKLADPKFTGSDMIPKAIINLQEIIKNFFGLDVEKDGEMVPGFNVLTVFEKIGNAKVNDKKIKLLEAITPLMEGVSSIVDVIQKVGNLKTDSGEPVDLQVAIDNLKLIITDVFPELQNIVTTLKINPSDVEKAKQTLEKMPSIIKTLIEINGVAGEEQIVVRSFEDLNEIVTQVCLLSQILSTNKKVIKEADIIIKSNLTSLVNKLVKIGKDSSKFVSLKENMQVNIIDPLLNLSEPVNQVEKLTGAISKLNSELSKLAKENTGTIQMVNSIGKTTPGQAVMGLVKGVGNAIGNAFGGDKSKNEMNANVAAIKDSVKKIEKSVAPKQESWLNVKVVE
jgi:hypothetical protein